MTPVVIKPKASRAPESVITTVRMRKTLLDEIEAEADRVGTSRNDAINQLLRYALDAHKKPKK